MKTAFLTTIAIYLIVLICLLYQSRNYRAYHYPAFKHHLKHALLVSFAWPLVVAVCLYGVLLQKIVKD